MDVGSIFLKDGKRIEEVCKLANLLYLLVTLIFLCQLHD